MTTKTDRIEAAKLRLLAGSPGPLVGAGMTGALATAALWPYADHRLLVAWATGMLLCTAFRFAVWRRFRRVLGDDAAVVRWARPLTVGIAVSGALWGLFGIGFYLLDEAEIRGFLLLVLASMLASAPSSTSPTCRRTARMSSAARCREPPRRSGTAAPPPSSSAR